MWYFRYRSDSHTSPKIWNLICWRGRGATEGLSRCHCRQKGRWRRWLMTWLTNAGHDSRHQPVNCAGLGVSIHPSHNLIPPRQSLTSRAPTRISDRRQLLRLKLLKSNHILQSSCVHKSRWVSRLRLTNVSDPKLLPQWSSHQRQIFATYLSYRVKGKISSKVKIRDRHRAKAGSTVSKQFISQFTLISTV